jgi:uncharacterized protein involved in exopolysaccharide biosynthesis
MSTGQPEDVGVERDIDLRRWWRALLSRWWIIVAGLIIGAILGGIYSLSGGSSYTATALIARGQAYNPAGSAPVLSYLSSPTAIQEYATSEPALRYAAAKAGISPGQLRGHVSTSTIGQTGAQQQNTNSTLVQISVALNKPKRAEEAADALADLMQKYTTSNYVSQSIAIYKVRLNNFETRLKTLQARISGDQTALKASSGLAPLDRLVIVTDLDAAEAAYGQTLDSQTTTQQLLTLAQEVEQTHIVQLAQAQKSTARSHRNSALVGAVIGLLIGAIIALILGLRATRVPAAA